MKADTSLSERGFGSLALSFDLLMSNLLGNCPSRARPTEPGQETRAFRSVQQR
jgi:hypothetical protein